VDFRIHSVVFDLSATVKELLKSDSIWHVFMAHGVYAIIYSYLQITTINSNNNNNSINKITACRSQLQDETLCTKLVKKIMKRNTLIGGFYVRLG